MTKQLHDLNGQLVLIDCSDSKHPELAYQIPTLEQDRSTWLELSERCGGKLEEGVHYMGSEKDFAYPTPQKEDLWEEAEKKAANHAEQIWDASKFPSEYWYEKLKYLKQHYHLTRKS